MKPGVGLTDMCTGLYMHGAILAALRARDATGHGQQVDTSLFEAQVSLLANVAMSWLNGGQEARRWGTGHPSIVPYDCFRTADAFFVAGAVNNRQFGKLCRLLGDEALGGDERFVDNDARVKNRRELNRILDDLFSQKSTDEWLEVFEDSGMPYGPINTMERVFSHPQTLARNMVKTIEDDSAVSGHVKVLGEYRHSSSPRSVSNNVQEFRSSSVTTNPPSVQRRRGWGSTRTPCWERLDWARKRSRSSGGTRSCSMREPHSHRRGGRRVLLERPGTGAGSRSPSPLQPGRQAVLTPAETISSATCSRSLGSDGSLCSRYCTSAAACVGGEPRRCARLHRVL